MVKRNPTTVKLSKALVLNRWVLAHFGVDALESLVDDDFKRSIYEGYDRDNKTHYHNQLKARQFTFKGISEAQLIKWDQNIVGHTLAISEKRERLIHWKYFQYLSLLFTELYLEKYFTNRDGLLDELNTYVEKWNDPMDHGVRNESGFVCPPYEIEEINKLAFWSATGSGKTLLMHINIKQYGHYHDLYGNKDNLNKVLLITPNEGLSEQHLRDFKESDIEAEKFSKRSGTLFSGDKVEVLEITKLAEESGEKTTAVEAFEKNNLVLVDEGHRGMDGKQWKPRRDQLSEEGFSFEYSATFGQVVAAATGAKRKALTEEYSKCTLMDYSYKYFYEDGYGKDYHILNIPEAGTEEFQRKYLTGALMSFYQQQRIIHENPLWESTFMLHPPLWVFVGGSVNAIRKIDGNDTSDVLSILKFYADFIADSSISKKHIAEIISGKDGIVDKHNRSVFTGVFNYINKHEKPIDELYADILEKVFHCNVSGAQVYLDHLKGQDGELGIRVGKSEYFGVINVGDAPKLFKLCQENGIEGEAKDFSNSLFHGINEKESKVNVLIGSKKFTEGWSCWRVSTMGLMNVGRSEGSQIIQLFGRGVRLKGYEFCLKRSKMLDQDQRPEIAVPNEIKAAETLGIFGIRADYMQQFREFLEEEGLPPNDSVFEEVELPVMLTTKLGQVKLKVVQLKEGFDFKKDEVVELKLSKVVGSEGVRLEWYPKLEMASGYMAGIAVQETEFTAKLQKNHLAFIDWDRVYFALQQYKNERSWYNLSISKEALIEIANDSDWYELSIPDSALELSSFERVKEWQQIVIALLKGYTERYYNLHKSSYFSDRMETVELTREHPNFMETYQLEIESSRQDIIDKITRIKGVLDRGEHVGSEDILKDFTVFEFLNHLYRPLIYIDSRSFKDIVKISPVALNKGEFDFVNHLKGFYEKNLDFFKDVKLYLLRNASRKGIGFFEASGFYPDFILWLVKGNHQYISFIDPKGLRQINGFDNPKLSFYKTVKEKIQKSIHEEQGDTDVTLDSFIVTPTKFEELKHWAKGHSIDEFNKHHVYFMKDQREDYIRMMLKNILVGKPKKGIN